VPSGERLTREEKKARTRERLVDAAARVFARKGFVATSLDEVAEEAGLTKGAVYSNFQNKEELVRAVLEERLETPLRRIAWDVQAEGNLEEDAVRASEELGTVLDKARDALLLSFDFAIHAVRDEGFRDEFTAYHRNAVEGMAGVIRERLGDEFELHVPAEILASVFDAVCNGVALERLMDPGALSDDVFGRLLAAVVETFTTRRGG
jgi:AcrR family transcriptional regulator